MSKIEEFKMNGLGIDKETMVCRECGGSGEATSPGRRPAKCWPCKGTGRVKVQLKKEMSVRR